MRLFEMLKKPLVVGLLAGIAGLAIGLMIGWMVWPVEYTDAVPGILSQKYQEEYLRMAIDSYRVNPNADLAIQRWQALAPNIAGPLFVAISQNPGQQDVGAILGFKAALESAGIQISAQPLVPTPVTPALNKTLLIAVAVLLVLAVIVLAAYYFFLKPLLFGRQPSTGEVSASQKAQEFTRSTEKTDYSEKGLEKPITQTMTTYVLGDDLYDESFSIDSQAGEFLGEYGVGVSETIGVGEPKKVTAIEIWLFDKNDIKTATKVLMSQHAFGDPNIRGRLEAKGELVDVQPQGQVILETATLQLLATLVDLEYGQGNMPAKSYFERITLELAIWPKG
jgi:hypothetical protein